MTMKVSIKIWGDVLFYKEENGWMVVFVTNAKHKALVSDNRGMKPYPLRKPGIFRQMKFHLDNSDVTGTGDSASSSAILNMNHPLLHGRDASGRSFLRPTRRPGYRRELVYLTIPTGILSAGQTTTDYWFEVRSGSRPGPVKGQINGQIAKEISISFDVSSGKDIYLLTVDRPGIPRIPWEYRRGENLEIEINNHCNSSSRHDFLNYYDALKNSRPGDLQFIAGKVNRRLSKDGTKEIIGQDGNCDPVIIEPPPGP